MSSSLLWEFAIYLASKLELPLPVQIILWVQLKNMNFPISFYLPLVSTQTEIVAICISKLGFRQGAIEKQGSKGQF